MGGWERACVRGAGVVTCASTTCPTRTTHTHTRARAHLKRTSLMEVMISEKKDRGPAGSRSSNTLAGESQRAAARVSASLMQPLEVE